LKSSAVSSPLRRSVSPESCSSVGSLEREGEDSVEEGIDARGTGCSDSGWVKREGLSSSVKANAKVFLSGRKLRWGRKADERNKTIPTNRILCMI
jgi:hypothetical protein